MKILIPMAGNGIRFKNAGYNLPKPLIDVLGKPMIVRVIENLKTIGLPISSWIFCVQKDHLEKYPIKEIISQYVSNYEIVTIDTVTEGAACTVLLAEKYITEEGLIISNCDQLCDFEEIKELKHDAYIYTFKDTNSKWSFVKLDGDKVIEVAEKKPISDVATSGIYIYKNGRDFVNYANKMIEKNIRVNNEFYVAPVFNEMILDGKYITILDSKMYGLGTPEDLKIYVDNFSQR